MTAAVSLDQAIRAKLEQFYDGADHCAGCEGAIGECGPQADGCHEMRAALLAVLDLHKPFERYAPAPGLCCEVCVEDVRIEYGSPVIAYESHPCPTVRRIAEKLGVEVDGG